VISVGIQELRPHQIHLANVLQLLSLDDRVLDQMIQQEASNPLNPVRDQIYKAYATVAKAPPETRGSIISDAAAQIRLWARPDIAWMTSWTTPLTEWNPPASSNHDPDLSWYYIPATGWTGHLADPQTGQPSPATRFTWEALGDPQQSTAPIAVFLILPHNDASPLPLATAWLTQMLQALGDLAARSPKGRLPRPVQFLLDEFGNLPPIPDMDKIASLGLGQGIRLLLIVQDYAQIEHLYQTEAARTIIANCGTQSFLKVNLFESADRFSKALGSTTIIGRNWSEAHGTGNGQQTQSWQYQGRELMTADELLRNPRGTVIVRQEGQLPAKLTLIPIDQWPPWDTRLADHPDARTPQAVRQPSTWPTTELDSDDDPLQPEDWATLDSMALFTAASTAIVPDQADQWDAIADALEQSLVADTADMQATQATQETRSDSIALF
jgi:hypothetical protein